MAFVQTYDSQQSVPLTFKVRVIAECGSSEWGVVNGISSPERCSGKDGGQFRIEVLQPNTNSFQIITETFDQQSTYTLFDLSGRVAASGRINQSEIVNISHLMNGMYFLHIETNNTPQVFRILKE